MFWQVDGQGLFLHVPCMRYILCLWHRFSKSTVPVTMIQACVLFLKTFIICCLANVGTRGSVFVTHGEIYCHLKSLSAGRMDKRMKTCRSHLARRPKLFSSYLNFLFFSYLIFCSFIIPTWLCRGDKLTVVLRTQTLLYIHTFLYKKRKSLDPTICTVPLACTS